METLSLARQKFFFVDCQTTGTSAARDQLLEVGWAWGKAEDEGRVSPETALLKIEGSVPKLVKKITGLTDDDLALALPPASGFERFRAAFSKGPPHSAALAHYAQFERPFLAKFCENHQEIFPLELFCTYRIAQRLFPEAPSRNVRGLAGYLGCEIAELQRAAQHVSATALIWAKIVAELERKDVLDLPALRAWLQEKPTSQKNNTKPVAMSYRLDRAKRLALPKGPGIYRMLSQKGEVLYVGKATSLHSRVNSYFRGGCAGDSRKLELLARVYDIEVEECASPLEAALLENEEIKRRGPRYNKALQPSTKALCFFSREFESISLEQSESHCAGPFREGGALEGFFRFREALQAGSTVLPRLFFEPLDEVLLKEAYALFTVQLGPAARSMRSLLAWGMKELRAWRKLQQLEPETEEEEAPAEEDDDEEESEPTAEDIALRFPGLLLHAASELRRARQLGALLNAEVSWEAEPGQWRSLTVRGGELLSSRIAPERATAASTPWQGLRGEHFDRMSVLLSELKRNPHRIKRFPPTAL